MDDHGFSPDDVVLLERDDEVQALGRMLQEAASGHGCAAAVLGPAGIGKTALMAAVAQLGVGRGMTRLNARGNEVETAFPFGATLQLLDPPLRSVGVADRDALLSDAAGLARGLFESVNARTRPSADPDFATMYGVYWLVAGLAKRSPLILVIDDIQWIDAPSLRTFSFLVRRLESLPVVVLIGARTGPSAESDAAEVFGGLTERFVLRPLSRKGVAEFLARSSLAGQRDELADVCMRSTKGNPFYLKCLIDDLVRRPDLQQEPAAAARISPRRVASALRRRLRDLSSPADEVARAISVLGSEAAVADIAAVLGLPCLDASSALASLTEADILTQSGLGRVTFVHPIVRNAVHESLSSADRATLHARAAQLRRNSGAPITHVAAHLLYCPPGAVPQAAVSLESAAQRALDDGAPDLASDYLRRALQEPVTPARRAELAAVLAHASTRSGSGSAEDDLRSAMALAQTTRARSLVVSDLAQLLQTMGRGDEAIGLLVACAKDCAADDPVLAIQLRAEALAVGDSDLAVRARATEQVRALDAQFPLKHSGSTGALQLAHAATDVTLSCASAEEAARLSQDALATDEQRGTGAVERQLFSLLCYFLMCADRFAEAEGHLDAAIATARSAGSAAGFAAASAWRGVVAQRRGDLRLAEAHASSSLEVARGTGLYLVEVTAVMALSWTLVDRGDPQRAAAEFNQASFDIADLTGFMQSVALDARGRIRLAQGDHQGGVSDLLKAGRSLAGYGLDNPACFEWRSAAAVGLLASGDAESAREYAAVELELARRWGAPRSIAIALRALARTSDAEEGMSLLRSAVDALEGSPAELERARALIALGETSRRVGRRVESRRLLRRGLDLAASCGAEADVGRARSELRIAGGRPRPSTRSGPSALTPSEQRIVQLAASGKSNPKIAQELFVTTKTVEMHLSSAYRKLGISSRTQLGQLKVIS